MAGFHFTVEVTGLRRMIEPALRLGRENWGRPLEQCADIWRRETVEVFMAGGKPKRWPPLSPVTIEGRRRGKKGRQGRFPRALPLLDTGRLYMSVTSLTPDSINELRPGELRVGTKVHYGPVHQFGTARAGRSRRVRIPPRPFVLLLPEMVDKFIKAFQHHIERILER